MEGWKGLHPFQFKHWASSADGDGQLWSKAPEQRLPNEAWWKFRQEDDHNLTRSPWDNHLRVFQMSFQHLHPCTALTPNALSHQTVQPGALHRTSQLYPKRHWIRNNWTSSLIPEASSALSQLDLRTEGASRMRGENVFKDLQPSPVAIDSTSFWITMTWMSS